MPIVIGIVDKATRVTKKAETSVKDGVNVVKAVPGVDYVLVDKQTGSAPGETITIRDGNNLKLFLAGEEEPSVVIEDYYLIPGQVIGEAENKKVHNYTPKSAMEYDSIGVMEDKQAAVQQPGTKLLAPITWDSFISGWEILAFLGVTVAGGAAVAISKNNHSGNDHQNRVSPFDNKDNGNTDDKDNGNTDTGDKDNGNTAADDPENTDAPADTAATAVIDDVTDSAETAHDNLSAVTPVLSGHLDSAPEEGQIVVISRDGNVAGHTTADGDGKWTFNDTGCSFEQGQTYHYTVRVEGNGVTGRESDPFSISYDITGQHEETAVPVLPDAEESAVLAATGLLSSHENSLNLDKLLSQLPEQNTPAEYDYSSAGTPDYQQPSAEFTAHDMVNPDPASLTEAQITLF